MTPQRRASAKKVIPTPVFECAFVCCQSVKVDSTKMSQSSELSEDTLQEMESEAMPFNTKRATKYGIKRFEEWLYKRGRGKKKTVVHTF